MPFIKVPIYRKHRLEKDDSIILEDQMILTLEISNKLLEKLLLSTDEAKREINHFATMQATKDIYYSAEEKERLSELTKKHGRSEEHTSELQSHSDLVCRLLLE